MHLINRLQLKPNQSQYLWLFESELWCLAGSFSGFNIGVNRTHINSVRTLQPSDRLITNELTNWLYGISGLLRFISLMRELNSLCESFSPELHNTCRNVSSETLLFLTNGETLKAASISSGIFSTCICACAMSRKSANLIALSSSHDPN